MGYKQTPQHSALQFQTRFFSFVAALMLSFSMAGSASASEVDWAGNVYI